MKRKTQPCTHPPLEGDIDCTGRVCAVRMRKERPTMRMSPGDPLVLAVSPSSKVFTPDGREFPTVKAAYESLTLPLAPIRCTATPPCGHCWYCLQFKTARP